MADDTASLKRICITFNVIFGILGSIILTIGIIGVSNNAGQNKEVQASIIFCVFGSLDILLALLGFYGAYKEKKWPLRVYIGILAPQFISIVTVAFSLLSNQSEDKSDQPTQLGEVNLEILGMRRDFAIGLVSAFAFVVVISIILSLALYCHIRDQPNPIPVTSCGDPNLPAYSALYKEDAC
ncbi:hypothetical protein MATL_G00248430 [Megalops atlanticus]|uniref:Uncharacterized protein n=1 Tax=Megalops atlanticus TaxID=7932 RepID=A0A9D3PEE4_MEGAT|nr:hypothetical protein MATL_G00248430 [Megalops atlanticus]